MMWKRGWQCCRRTRLHAMHVLDPDAQDQDHGFQQHHRRTYYYSMFAARLAIMVMLAILIALLTILTWHFTTVYTTRSIENLAFDLRTELLNRPIARMINLLNSTVESTLSQVHLAKFVVGQYSLPMDATTQSQQFCGGRRYVVDITDGIETIRRRRMKVQKTIRNVSWAIFSSINAAKAITIIYSNGQLQSFDRNVATNQTYYTYTNPSNGTLLGAPSTDDPTLAPALAPANAQAPVSTWPDVSPSSNISWFVEAVDSLSGVAISPPQSTPSYNLDTFTDPVFLFKDGDVAWQVTVSDFEDTPLLSSEAAVRHPETGTVLAVTGITTALASINNFLRELTVAHSGYLYLTTADGHLLASSTNASLIDTSKPQKALVLANESSDPVITAGAQWLYKHYGNAGLLTQAVHAEGVVLEGQRFYIDTFSLELPRLQIVGVILIPRSFVMGEVDRRGRATLAILIAVSCCILLVGCIFILILTSGVSTEMKLRAELINHLDARRRAEASSNYKSQFLANMSHELRTPMAAVIGLLDILLCDDCLSSEQVNLVSQIRRCSTALLRLLNNILDLSKVESGKLVLEEVDFDLNRELEGLVDMFSVQCVEHDIEIVLDLADDMPRMVKGDSARTVQIFANLISNSLKFTSSGHVILRGWCDSPTGPARESGREKSNPWNHHRLGHDLGGPTSLDPGKILLWFEVEDTGCGIDSSKWEAVFDSFVQADPSTTRTYGGTGLGLCIVRSLVRKMGGDIKVVKKQGPGTLMRFYLVFNQPSECEVEIHRFTIPPELENGKVLLAMKGDVGRGTLAQWMHYRGLQIYEASDWDETLQVLQGLLQEHKTGCTSVSGQNEFTEPEAYKMAHHSLSVRPDGEHNNSVPDDAENPLLSGNPAEWNLRSSKVLVVLDSELFWKGDSHVESMLAVLDEYRDQGVVISWLLNHDTPNSLKTQLRVTRYSITAHQPLYKSKLLQLLTSMVGYVDRESSENEASGITDKGGFKLGYFEGNGAAATDSPELEKIRFQVLEKWASKKGLLSMENVTLQTYQSDQSRVGQTDSALIDKTSHEDPDTYVSISVSENDLERSKSFNNRSIGLHTGINSSQQREELHDMKNTCPSECSGTVEARSPASRNGCLIPSPLYINRNLRSSIPSANNSNEIELTFIGGGPINHLVDIPPDLPNGSSHPHPTSSIPLDTRGKDGNFGIRSEEDFLEAGLLDDNSNKTGTSFADNSACNSESSQRFSLGVNQSSVPDPVDRSTVVSPAHQIDDQRTQPTVSRKPDGVGNLIEIVVPSAATQAISQSPQENSSTRSGSVRRSRTGQLGSSNALSGICILLAEDTPVLQRVATIMLEKMGARVVVVSDGLQAVETIQRIRDDSIIADTNEVDQSSPAPVKVGSIDDLDLILMDCQMPRMDGYEATRAIRKAEEGREWHIPIVALTAHAMSSDEAKCLEVGMDAYLTKPIDCKLLVSTILSLTKKGS